MIRYEGILHISQHNYYKLKSLLKLKRLILTQPLILLKYIDKLFITLKLNKLVNENYMS